MIKIGAVALACGFLGAALHGRLFPPASPYDYIAVANYMDMNASGNSLSSAQIKLVQHRASEMAKAGYIIFNASSLYSYPQSLQIPQTVSVSEK
ncbi:MULTISPECIES: hypothetical protein [Photorhabdus]|uniref:DUF1471 domain-containing protein n=2 Tax=Photorhabdus TaxID=29487 RepID=A0AAW6BPR5_9GAMM|nr:MULTISPECIES: hypothetical protein [Photorhabdus]EYU15112.1 hypothetical protein BA1DRAFT_02382 [Photorhabdus aegyptia]MDB6373957.1 hypothetical protein [Photorhabdus bodei]